MVISSQMQLFDLKYFLPIDIFHKITFDTRSSFW